MIAGSMPGRRKVKQSPYAAAHSDRNWSGREAQANACTAGLKAGPSGSGSAWGEGLIREDGAHRFEWDVLETCGQPSAASGWQSPYSAWERFKVKFCGIKRSPSEWKRKMAASVLPVLFFFNRPGSRQEVQRAARMYQRNSGRRETASC